MRHTKGQIAAALALLNATGSPGMVIKTPGYPSDTKLNIWREKYPEYISRPTTRHFRQAPANIKKQATQRCLSGGDSVKSVAEDIGYSVSIVYRWIRKYRKEGLISFIKKSGPKKIRMSIFLTALGHLKTEMLYGHNRDDYSIPEFIRKVDSYIRWYYKDRIKSTLGGLSPLQYRKELGVGV